MALNAAASSRPPVLRIATPVAVPLLSSSNLDCSQVRVPSPMAQKTTERMLMEIREDRLSKGIANFIPHRRSLEGRIQVITRKLQLAPGTDTGSARTSNLLDCDCEHLRAGNHVIQRTGGGLVHRRLALHHHLLSAAHAVHYVS